jgi:multiple sugar transport system substrate-binding protein
MHHTRTLAGLALTTALVTAASAASAAEITLMRFFGDCQNEYGSVNNAADANGECGIITALTNQFNAENEDGHTVTTQTAEWGAYYDLLTATYETGNIPDVAVMHSSILPNFTSRNLLEPLTARFDEYGIDTADFVPAALENASGEDGEIYALPFDLHALLFHVNMDLMEQAGFVNEDGTVRLPSSPEEFIEMGKQFEEATGKNFVAVESQSAEGMMIRLFQSLMWQRGIDVLSADGKTAAINSPEAVEVAGFVKSIYDEGLADTNLDYPGAEQAFLNGDAGIIINGTWVVDSYNAQAESGNVGLKNYSVSSVPAIYGTQAVWADSHMWVVPKDESRSEEELDAAMDFLKFLNDNNFEWSRTGHLSVRQSVIDSPEFAALPHRSSFANTSDIAHAVPQTQNQRGVFNAMISDFNAMWLGGTEPQAALDAAQANVERILRRNRG